MRKIKTAVIGVGYLGKFHAAKYKELENSDLVAVVDANHDTAKTIAKKYGVEACTDYRKLLGKVEAVSIVTPTVLHFPIAKDFITHGSHVLIEKPIAVTTAEADKLVELAKEQNRIIQVGHIERFNAAMLGLDKIAGKPDFIESHRLAPFNPRATDVNVVLDLMIHDIDIILDIVKSAVKTIAVSGTSVLTDTTDIANGRLEFANGCVANVTASRVSMKTERKMRIFQPNSYITMDFHKRTINVYRKGREEMYPGIPNIKSLKKSYDDNDALMVEIKSFLNSIETGTPAVVSGEDGRRALDVAIRISNLLSEGS